MAIDLYMMEASPPCRVVMLVAKYIGIELNKIHINLTEGEHMTPEFMKMNPQHCVPTIDDNGFYLWESRAIITYLVNQYASDSELYPKDPKRRAVIDKFLYFDIGTLYKTLSDAMHDPLFKEKQRNLEMVESLKSTLQILEEILEKSPFVAGETLSLADISIIITLNTAKLMAEAIQFDYSSLLNIQSWAKRVKEHLPFFNEVNDTGEKQMKEYLASMK